MFWYVWLCSNTEKLFEANGGAAIQRSSKIWMNFSLPSLHSSHTHTHTFFFWREYERRHIADGNDLFYVILILSCRSQLCYRLVCVCVCLGVSVCRCHVSHILNETRRNDNEQPNNISDFFGKSNEIMQEICHYYILSWRRPVRRTWYACMHTGVGRAQFWISEWKIKVAWPSFMFICLKCSASHSWTTNNNPIAIACLVSSLKNAKRIKDCGIEID